MGGFALPQGAVAVEDQQFELPPGATPVKPSLAEQYDRFGQEHPYISGALALIPGLGNLSPTAADVQTGVGKQIGRDAYDLVTGPGAGPLGIAAGYLADKAGLTAKVHGATALANPGEKIGGLATNAAEIALPLPKGVAAIEKAIPTAEKAGSKFASVMESAHDLPINVAQPGNVALEARQLAASGGVMPKVMRDFINRATDPNMGPITYKEARDFYSNATRLSFDEAQRLTPVMKRQAGMFTNALGKSLEEAAAHVDKLHEYQQAMKEYHTAMRIRSLWEDIKDLATSAAVKGAGAGAAGAYAVKELLK